MRTTNCERVNDLLSFYVAGDLDAARAREVAAHVSSCEKCRALAAGFGASRALLAEACEPPEFGEEFYAGIRGAVLSEIARDRLTPSKPSPLAALFPARRLAFAATFALLLLASFVAFRHFARNARGPQQQTEVPQQIVRETTPQSNHPPQKIDKVIPVQTSDGTTLQPARSSSPTAATHKPLPGVGDDSGLRVASVKVGRTPGELTAVGPDRREASAAARIPRENGGAAVAAAARESPDPARAATTQLIAPADPSNGANAPAESANAAASKVSRIEIQTADPNIRIIWLTPQKTDEPARDRDNHENGDRN